MRIVSAETEERDREGFAEFLEDVAREVRSGSRSPDAIFIQIYSPGLALSRFERGRDTFQVLHAIGGFEVIKSKLLKNFEDAP